jgi:hypothetical protein
MQAWLFILAQAATPEVTPEDLKRAPGRLPGFQLSDLLMIIAAALLVLTAVVLWAVFIRKPKADVGRTRVYKSRPREEETEDGMIRKRKKVKKPRREHRTRNPTLSEAGGLPPVRPDGSAPPV